jgi:citrate synthase
VGRYNGGANEAAAMIEQYSSEEEAVADVLRKLEEKELIMGFWPRGISQARSA